MKKYLLQVVIEQDEDGVYLAHCPALEGCYTQGDTYEEALENIRDAIHLHVQDRLEANETINQSESISLTSLEIAV